MIHAFKGFNKDLSCNGFKYEEGKEFVFDGEPKLCSRGFHACEDPIDCFGYYSPTDSVFHAVELDDVSSERKDDSKVVAKKIRIGARLSFRDMIKASIDFRFSKATPEPGSTTDKKQASVSATGDRGAASATGDRGAASATGYSGAASATGYRGAASATGDSGAALSNGNLGCASVSGKDSVAIALGYEGAAKAELGSWIVLTERGGGVWNDEKGYYEYPIIEVKAFKVDGKKIKPNTFYCLKKGKAVLLETVRGE